MILALALRLANIVREMEWCILPVARLSTLVSLAAFWQTALSYQRCQIHYLPSKSSIDLARDPTKSSGGAVEVSYKGRVAGADSTAIDDVPYRIP